MSNSDAGSDAAEESRLIMTKYGPTMAPEIADDSDTESDGSDAESDDSDPESDDSHTESDASDAKSDASNAESDENNLTTPTANEKKTALTLPPWITKLSNNDLMDLIKIV